MSLGDNIYKLRISKNLSQGDLAEALDVSRQSVSKWENNSATPELEKLVKMSQLFGISLDALAGNVPPETPKTEYPPAEESPRQNTDLRKIVGIVLLGFGLAAFIVFTALSFADNPGIDFEFGLLLSAPLVISGIICMGCKHHPGYFCALTIYLFIWLPLTVLVQYTYGTIAGIVNLAVMAFGFGLLLYTVIRFRSLKIHTLPKALIITGLILSLFIRVSAMMPPREEEAIAGDIYTNIGTESIQEADASVLPD